MTDSGDRTTVTGERRSLWTFGRAVKWTAPWAALVLVAIWSLGRTVARSREEVSKLEAQKEVLDAGVARLTRTQGELMEKNSQLVEANSQLGNHNSRLGEENARLEQRIKEAREEVGALLSAAPTRTP